MEGVNNEPYSFALGIKIYSPDSNSALPFSIQTINRGIPKEVVLTAIRNWLKKKEDNYYEDFSKTIF